MSLTARSRPSLIPFAIIATVIAMNALWYINCVTAEPVNSPKIVWQNIYTLNKTIPEKLQNTTDPFAVSIGAPMQLLHSGIANIIIVHLQKENYIIVIREGNRCSLRKGNYNGLCITFQRIVIGSSRKICSTYVGCIRLYGSSAGVPLDSSRAVNP